MCAEGDVFQTLSQQRGRQCGLSGMTESGGDRLGAFERALCPPLLTVSPTSAISFVMKTIQKLTCFGFTHDSFPPKSLQTHRALFMVGWGTPAPAPSSQPVPPPAPSFGMVGEHDRPHPLDESKDRGALGGFSQPVPVGRAGAAVCAGRGTGLVHLVGVFLGCHGASHLLPRHCQLHGLLRLLYHHTAGEYLAQAVKALAIRTSKVLSAPLWKLVLLLFVRLKRSPKHGQETPESRILLGIAPPKQNNLEPEQ